MTTFDYETDEVLFLEHVATVKRVAEELAGDMYLEHPESFDQFKHWLDYGWHPYAHTVETIADIWEDLCLELNSEEVDSCGYFSNSVSVSHGFDYETFYSENKNSCDSAYFEYYDSETRGGFMPDETVERACDAWLTDCAMGDLYSLKQEMANFDTDNL